MDHLQVEELEPRQLLSRTGLPFQLPLAKPPSDFAEVSEHAPLIHLGGTIYLAEQGRPEGAAGSPGLPPSMALVDFEGKGPEGLALRGLPQGPGGTSLEKWIVYLPDFGKDTPGHCLDALAIPGNSRMNPAPLPGAPLLPVLASYGVTGVLGVLGVPSAAPNFQPRLFPESQAGARGLAVEMPRGDAIRPPAATGIGREGVFAIGGNDGEGVGERSPIGADLVRTVSDAESSEPPRPLAADVAAVLLPVDLSALELGMQRFLQELERSGQHLVEELEDTNPSPWIVAVAAAATACEIARRQLRTPREGPGADVTRFAGFPPESPFAG